MIRRVSLSAISLSSILVLLCSTGCRHEEPADLHAKDLGDGNTILLPTSSVFKQPGIADGRADWVDFRDPDEVPPATGSNAEATPGTVTDAAAIESEIREVLAEYNGLPEDPDATIDSYLDYYVTEQADQVSAVLEAAQSYAQALAQLRQDMQAKKAEAADQIDAAVNNLESTTVPTLNAQSVTVNSDTSVTVALASGPLAPAIEFVIIDDQWFIQLSDANSLQQAKSSIDQSLANCRVWIDELSAGRTSIDDAIAQVEAAAPSVQPQDVEAEATDN